MRILLTNDDGVTSPGIVLLAKSLREAGHRVFVVAPDSNMSGTSHSITFLNIPCKLNQIENDTWSCSGTPVDCVIIALLGGIPELCIKETRANAPDLLLAGINVGANIGTDIVYSGTAAAARQGSFFSIPSIALSLVEGDEGWHWGPVISFITNRLEEISGYWKEGTFVNVNFPNTKAGASGLVPAFPSQRCYNDGIKTFPAPYGGYYCFAKVGDITSSPEPLNNGQGSDWDAVKKNNASISVVFSQPVVVGKDGA